MLREELKRIIDVMQNDVIPKERQLHDLIEKMNSSYLDAMQRLHSHGANFKDSAASEGSKLDSQRKQMLDPLQEAEQEVARMQQMLAQPVVVSPDVPPEMVRQMQQNASRAEASRAGAMSSQQPSGYLAQSSVRAPMPPRSPQATMGMNMNQQIL